LPFAFILHNRLITHRDRSIVKNRSKVHNTNMYSNNYLLLEALFDFVCFVFMLQAGRLPTVAVCPLGV